MGVLAYASLFLAAVFSSKGYLSKSTFSKEMQRAEYRQVFLGFKNTLIVGASSLGVKRSVKMSRLALHYFHGFRYIWNLPLCAFFKQGLFASSSNFCNWCHGRIVLS